MQTTSQTLTKTLLVDLGTQVAKIYYSEFYFPPNPEMYKRLTGLHTRKFYQRGLPVGIGLKVFRELTEAEEIEYSAIMQTEVELHPVVTEIKLIEEDKLQIAGFCIILGENFCKINKAIDNLKKQYYMCGTKSVISKMDLNYSNTPGMFVRNNLG